MSVYQTLNEKHLYDSQMVERLVYQLDVWVFGPEQDDIDMLQQLEGIGELIKVFYWLKEFPRIVIR